MIELPEAAVLARQLEETIKGKEIIDVVVGFTPHKFAFYYKEPEEYVELLAGKKITGACHRGGLVEIQAEDRLLVMSDGANIKYLKPGSKLPAKHQLLIGFDDQSCIVVSVRMYAMLWCCPEGELLHEYYLTGKNRPNAFSDAFTRSYFLQLMEGEEMAKKSAKAFLATEQRIPGLGNGVLQDILYEAGIHPKKLIKTLTEEQKDRLYRQIGVTLSEMYGQGGRSTEKDLFGQPGRYITRLTSAVVNQPCSKCGTLIQKENYMGGSIYYCPECQPM